MIRINIEVDCDQVTKLDVKRSGVGAGLENMEFLRAVLFNAVEEITPPIVYTPVVTVASGPAPTMPQYTVQRFQCTDSRNGTQYLIPFVTINNSLPGEDPDGTPFQVQCNMQGLTDQCETTDLLWYQAMTVQPPDADDPILHALFDPFIPAPSTPIDGVDQVPANQMTLNAYLNVKGLPGGASVCYTWMTINGESPMYLFLQQPPS